MADKKNSQRPSEKRIEKVNNANVKGLFSMYDFSKPANKTANKTTKKK